nr:ORF39 [Ostreid herpesvirus 1]
MLYKFTVLLLIYSYRRNLQAVNMENKDLIPNITIVCTVYKPDGKEFTATYSKLKDPIEIIEKEAQFLDRFINNTIKSQNRIPEEKRQIKDRDEVLYSIKLKHANDAGRHLIFKHGMELMDCLLDRKICENEYNGSFTYSSKTDQELLDNSVTEFIENSTEEEMMIIDNAIDDIMCDDCNLFEMVDDYYLKWVLY